MGSKLTAEQMLLLNNLMYLPNSGPLSGITSQRDNWTVGDIISSIRAKQASGKALDANKDYGQYITGSDWENIVSAIEKDPALMSVKLLGTQKDPDGGASALFADPASNEAIVVFVGTTGQTEWKDNFIGGGKTGAADGVSTPNQERANEIFNEYYEKYGLDKYDSVAVSGHSKGGNKAKYIAIMNDKVDRCISYDGQGFSDEFMERYADRIAARQHKIQNHNVASDYVNLLLNDIGETHFYEGHDLGKGGFLENHCPNTFFGFDENGRVIMTECERSQAMAALDIFLNSYLRSKGPEEKADTLEFIGNVASIILAGNKKTKLMDIFKFLLLHKTKKKIEALINYVKHYEDENIVDVLKILFNDFELNYIGDILDRIENIKDLYDLIKDPSIGEDIRIPDSASGSVELFCIPENISAAGDGFISVARSVDSVADSVLGVKNSLSGSLKRYAPTLLSVALEIQVQAKQTEKLGSSARDIARAYNKTENRAKELCR